MFARELAVFPPPVLDVADTFFSAQVPVTPGNPGRRYLGVCAHGVRLKSAEIRLAEILLLAGQTLFDRSRRARRPLHDRSSATSTPPASWPACAATSTTTSPPGSAGTATSRACPTG